MGDAGVVLDIDGVLKRGKTAIEGAKEALLLLQQHNINYAMVTNGGGTRKKKADFVTNLLGVEVNDEQMIVSHTPLITFDVMNRFLFLFFSFFLFPFAERSLSSKVRRLCVCYWENSQRG